MGWLLRIMVVRNCVQLSLSFSRSLYLYVSFSTIAMFVMNVSAFMNVIYVKHISIIKSAPVFCVFAIGFWSVLCSIIYQKCYPLRRNGRGNTFVTEYSALVS